LKSLERLTESPRWFLRRWRKNQVVLRKVATHLHPEDGRTVKTQTKPHIHDHTHCSETQKTLFDYAHASNPEMQRASSSLHIRPMDIIVQR
jgi:hypothetical protein